MAKAAPFGNPWYDKNARRSGWEWTITERDALGSTFHRFRSEEEAKAGRRKLVREYNKRRKEQS